MEIAYKLESVDGYAVIQCVYDSTGSMLDSAMMQNLFDAHRKKIEISDMVYIVNIGGYIGNATRGEIEYATSLGKEVVYHENN